MKIAVGKLELAQFTEADTEDLFRVRNHESVRAFMANPAPLDWERHVAWTRENLIASGRILLFIVRLEGRALGFTLLKLIDARAAEIGVVVCEARRHRLIASDAGVLTLHVAFDVMRFERVVSYVVPSHGHALDFNRRAGFREVGCDKPGMVRLDFTRNEYLRNVRCRRMLARMRSTLRLIRG